MDAIRTAFDRCVQVLTLRPARGRATGVSRTRLRHGLVCRRSVRIVSVPELPESPEVSGADAVHTASTTAAAS